MVTRRAKMHDKKNNKVRLVITKKTFSRLNESNINLIFDFFDSKILT